MRNLLQLQDFKFANVAKFTCERCKSAIHEWRLGMYSYTQNGLFICKKKKTIFLQKNVPKRIKYYYFILTMKNGSAQDFTPWLAL